MKNNFFAMLFRQKYIRRWGLMRNTRSESLTEHAYETAVLAHVLALIGNRELSRSYDPEKTALAALYHDATEVYTGDMPTPVKYFNSGIRDNYRAIEKNATERLLSGLPEELRSDYRQLIEPEDRDICRLVKAADKLSAYIKCVEELKAGNTEFESARMTTLESMKALDCRELDVFIERYLPAFSLDIDQMQQS